MTSNQLEFTLAHRGASQNDRLRAYLEDRPNRWIPMPELGRAIGAWAVHSRISDLRTKFGMRIDHRSRRDAVTGQHLPEYRFSPLECEQKSCPK